jgi:pyruvate formate lyase activating enzyme
MKEAAYYESRENNIQCLLCPHECTIAAGKSGRCRVRQHARGKLFTNNYAACTAYALDPIEKKPLYHFYPGSNILSSSPRPTAISRRRSVGATSGPICSIG